ncbi:MAG: hypothetical protein ACE14M_14190 [Terriglobales bacterium]
MAIELSRLAFGLLLLLFHRQVADYILERERQLVILFRQRGVPLPAAPTTEVGRNIYFFIAAFIVLYQVARIWLILGR